METPKPNWTNEQSMAINAHCADNLVSAAAGSGKTAVMVERIVSRIISGAVDIDKILVVTFTNAAASELKSRLMNKIMDSLENAQNSDRLNRQLVLINTASICTIDSFCLDILRNNFYKLGLDPDIKVGDTAELEIIKTDVLNKVFEEYYKSNDKVFLDLVNSYTQKNDKELIGIIEKIYNFTNSLPGGINELNDFKARFADNNLWKDYFIKKAKNICARAIAYYDEAIQCAEGYEAFEKVYNQLIDEKNNYVLLEEKSSWDEIKGIVDKFEFPALYFPRNTDESDKNAVKLPRDKGKNLKDELYEIFRNTYEDLESHINNTCDSVEKIIEIVARFSKAFRDEKKNKGIVDFVDVEHMALNLLQDECGGQSDLAKQLMDKYTEIYVDEYQDCNSVQEKLFSLISRANIGNPNMFLVGDMKQSIYGFRGSEPGLFKDKADRYEMYNKCSKFNKILLNKNFRSRKTIIDCVNSIFSQIMSVPCGELDYDKDEYLYYNEVESFDSNEDLNFTDIALIETDNEELDSFGSDIRDSFLEMKGMEAEAIYIADKIKSMVGGNEDGKPYLISGKEAGSSRPVRYSDIVILLRSGGEKAETLNRILNAYQIPVYCDFGSGYFDAPEVAFLINFLKVIDNPFDDVALLSIMRHPTIGFTDDEFLSVRLSKPKGYFYSSIQHYIRNNETVLKTKLSDFVCLINDFYEKSKYLTTDKLIDEVVNKTDYLSYVSFMHNPELRKANVLALITRAHDFEKTSYKGIFDFIKYVDNLKKNNKDIEPAKTLSDDEDVVRIMTIHKSKGLEFPVVFLANSFKQFNDKDIRSDKILLDKDFGFGVNFYDYYSRYYYELPQKKLIKDVKYRNMLSEEMRVLYVALTRPKEKLIITGSGRKINSKIQKLAALVADEDMKLSPDVSACAKSYGDWILMSVLRNKACNCDLDVVKPKFTLNDGSLFNVQIIPKNNLVMDLPSDQTKRHINDMPRDAELCEKVKDYLDFVYPSKNLSGIPSNMSVTELKRRSMEGEDTFNYYNNQSLKIPRFLNENDKLSAAQKGTLVHYFMEKFDFSRATEVDCVEKQVLELTSCGLINEKEAKYIDCQKITDILNTDIGKEICKYKDTLKREFGFKISVDATKVFPKAPATEKIVVQGMVDAYYTKSDGSVVIVDYKTDKVDDVETFKDKYSVQLKYYKAALETALGVKVTSTYLLLLDIGQALEVEV